MSVEERNVCCLHLTDWDFNSVFSSTVRLASSCCDKISRKPHHGRFIWFTVRGNHNIVNFKAEKEQEVGLGYKALTTLHWFFSFSKAPPPKCAATSPDSVISWGTSDQAWEPVGGILHSNHTCLVFLSLNLNGTVSLFLSKTHSHHEEQCDNICENALETIDITLHNLRPSQLPFFILMIWRSINIGDITLLFCITNLFLERPSTYVYSPERGNPWQTKLRTPPSPTRWTNVFYWGYL